MKALHIFFLLALVSCGRESSPEGRSIIRNEQICKQIDSLKLQNRAMFDSIASMAKRLEELEQN